MRTGQPGRTESADSPDDAVRRLRAAGCVFAEDEARLLTGAAASAAELDAMIERRIAGLPLEHILGWAEFCGLRVGVATGVFVPRRRTEFLVRQAELLLRGSHDGGSHDGGRGAAVVDLCCGSGAVGAALAARVAGIELHASDLDPNAVLCARRNLEPAGGRVHEGDLFEPLPDRLRGRIGILVANAPYVPTAAIGTMPPEARTHEPRMSLDGGPDGLDIQRRVVAGAPDWLAPGGHVLIETSRRQAGRTIGLMRQAGLAARLAGDPELDATVAIGTLAGSSTG
ncbi:release factor glutamine methyltransferase [Arthrobacter oryzae]|nr:release factor glutamine methyltransferase [Arthrobacter oryzae]